MSAVDWSRVDVVLLDMDGTLLDLRYDNEFWFDHLPGLVAARRGMPVAEVHGEIQQHAAAIAGTLDFYCLDYWSARLGLDVARANAELAHLIRIRPEVPEFLAWLRDARRPVWLVTNSHVAGLDFKLERTGLRVSLDAVISAHELGVPKEHPGFWQALAGKGVNLARSLLVDDNLAVLKCARAAGVGQCLAVRQPDSARPPQETHEWRAVDGFLALLPVPEVADPKDLAPAC